MQSTSTHCGWPDQSESIKFSFCSAFTFMQVCLFDPKEISLCDIMRSGASDDELLQVIHQAVVGKKAKHAGMDSIDVTTNRPMILIGG